MQWDDSGILLSVRKHGENGSVARLFAREHGVSAGVIRLSKANRGMLQPGNILSVHWQARLAEHLGTFKAELQEAHTAHIMHDAGRLAALTSACILIESALPEHHPYPRLYQRLHAFLVVLRDSEHWPEAYVKLELMLLSEAGFGLDLSSCAATGSKEDLVYVSPKSGRAACREAGAPYHDQLLQLPSFLLPGGRKNAVEPAEILAGLELTGYFLDHWLLEPHRRKLPAVRSRLIDYVKEHHGEETAA